MPPSLKRSLRCLRKVPSYINKSFLYLIFAFALILPIEAQLGTYYSSDYLWAVQDNSYLSFNPGINLIDQPHQGPLIESSLVGYWPFNEPSGNIATDNSGNGNNGTIKDATYVEGKFGKALSFDGVNSYVETGASCLSESKPFSLSLWFKANTFSGIQYLVGETYDRFGINIGNGYINFRFFDNASHTVSYGPIVVGIWYHVVGVYDYAGLHLTINGSNVSNSYGNFNNVTFTDSVLRVGCQVVNGKQSNFFNGIIDEVTYFKRALTILEIRRFYLMGPYAQPDPITYAEYYNFTDATTNNTMFLLVNNKIPNKDITAITCTNFFVNNRLVFKANNTATLNIWTSLGQPLSLTNSVWNIQNYTTTLMLDESLIVDLKWIADVPNGSYISVTSTTVSSNTTFSTLWTDVIGLSGGGYIFSSNNTGQWLNASWAAFNSNSGWGNATSTLSNIVGTVVGFREYANNSLNLWGDSGIYAITTTNDTSKATPTPTPSSAPTTTPTPTTSTPTLTPTVNPTITPTLQPEANQFPILTVAIVATAVAVLVAVFALAFKKGFITIEVVDEENPESSEDKSEDYAT
jgi:hypothetical protein